MFDYPNRTDPSQHACTPALPLSTQQGHSNQSHSRHGLAGMRQDTRMSGGWLHPLLLRLQVYRERQLATHAVRVFTAPAPQAHCPVGKWCQQQAMPNKTKFIFTKKIELQKKLCPSHSLQLPLLVGKLSVEGTREIVTQVVAGTRLQQ